MYDPTPGIFLSRDPIGAADDENEYRYVKNNPTNFIDPTGEYAEADDAKSPLKKEGNYYIVPIYIHDATGDGITRSTMTKYIEEANTKYFKPHNILLKMEGYESLDKDKVQKLLGGPEKRSGVSGVLDFTRESLNSTKPKPYQPSTEPLALMRNTAGSDRNDLIHVFLVHGIKKGESAAWGTTFAYSDFGNNDGIFVQTSLLRGGDIPINIAHELYHYVADVDNAKGHSLDRKNLMYVPDPNKGDFRGGKPTWPEGQLDKEQVELFLQAPGMRRNE